MRRRNRPTTHSLTQLSPLYRYTDTAHWHSNSRLSSCLPVFEFTCRTMTVPRSILLLVAAGTLQARELSLLDEIGKAKTQCCPMTKLNVEACNHRHDTCPLNNEQQDMWRLCTEGSEKYEVAVAQSSKIWRCTSNKLYFAILLEK